MYEITFYENQVTAEELLYLQESVGFGKANLLQSEKALKNSLYCISAKVDGKTAGMGRVIGDGARIFYLQDVFIAPDYQRMGIGTEIMTHLLNYIKANAIEHAHTTIGLMSAKGKENFYLKFGFRVRPNEKEGPGMMFNFTNN
ncbi:MAG: family acetyltransferase [Anaerocolumna sp.]|jgi:GNAT superfamily N-acetyltransferase|nr:family acetyltransferase [Anaerocolumna sp.]